MSSRCTFAVRDDRAKSFILLTYDTLARFSDCQFNWKSGFHVSHGLSQDHRLHPYGPARGVQTSYANGHSLAILGRGTSLTFPFLSSSERSVFSLAIEYLLSDHDKLDTSVSLIPIGTLLQ